MTRVLVLVGILVLIGVLAWIAPPEPPVESVFDVAEMLDPDAEQRIRQVSDSLRADERKAIAVITIESALKEGFRDLSAFTSTLLDRSQGYDRLRGKDWHGGVLLVFSSDEGHVSMDFGAGWSQDTRDQLAQAALTALSEHCARGQCAEGLVAAVEAIDRKARTFDVKPLSYWGKFAAIYTTTLREFLRAATNPWVGFGYFKWIVIFFVVWEFVRPWRKQQRKLRRQIGLDIFYTVFTTVLFWPLFGTAVCEITHILFTDAMARFFGIQNMVAVRLYDLPVWLRYLSLLLALDLMGYWVHRLMHWSNFLWEFHKVHHSAPEIDCMNAMRLHFVEQLTNRALAYIPIGMIGFAVTDTFVMNVFISVFSMFTHANVKLPLGPLKYVLNNPQMHIWHHGLNVHARGNVNYGDALSMWDYIFGTAYTAEDYDNLKIGIDDIDEYPTSFWGQLVAPFKTNLARARKS